MESVDLGDLCLFLQVTGMMGQLVMPLRNADESIIAVTPGTRIHESGDSRHVALKSEDHHVAQKANVLPITLRETGCRRRYIPIMQEC